MSLAQLSSLAFFALIWLTQVMTPGPNFVRISHMALTVSRRAAMTTAAGTTAGNCSWCIAAAVGAALLMQDPLTRQALALFGAAYFAWFGTRLLLSAIRGRKALQRAEARAVNGLTAFRAGYTTAIANPQAILFFVTVFITMFPKLTLDLVGIVLAIVAGVTLGWYAVVTTILTAAPARRIYERARALIDLVFAAVLWTAAIRLALTRGS
ncbi:MAG TPA: LysE family transporter [Allosphingosinicella sp.]|uniref:LysE family translocator n=1 Tax=Allosphingosinicella sp. TaxID=2823234 RepID=UPI002ED99122